MSQKGGKGGGKVGKFRILMGWGLKFLRCRTVHVVSFPKMPHFSKSDKWKYSKMRGNYPVGRNEAVVSQSVVSQSERSRITGQFREFQSAVTFFLSLISTCGLRRSFIILAR